MIERRKFKRFKIITDLMVNLPDNSKKMYCVAYDISQENISFVSLEDLQIGQKCVITILVNNRKYKGIIASKAEFKKRGSMKKYGIHFQAPISIGIVQHLLKDTSFFSPLCLIKIESGDQTADFYLIAFRLI